MAELVTGGEGLVRDRIDAADLATVVGELREVHGVVSELYARDDGELAGGAELILGVGLVGVGLVLLAEVGQGVIDVGEGIGRELVAVGVCPLIPEAGAEDAELRGLADGESFAIFAIAVVLVDGAGADALDRLATGGIDDRGGLGRFSVKLGVVVVVGVRLEGQQPAVVELVVDADVLEVRGDVVGVVEVVVGLRGVGVLQQVVVTELKKLSASRAEVRSVGVEPDDAAVAGEDGLVGELVLILQRAGVAGLVVEGLVAVGRHVVDVDEEIRLLVGSTEVAGVVGAVEEEGVEGAVGEAAADVLLRSELLGEEMDGAAEGRGPNGGGSAGAAVEVDSADPLRGEEGPGVVAGGVGVVEGDAVEVDVVLAVREATEVGGALAEADSVGVGGVGAGDHLGELAVVGDGRGVVLNVGRD